jgi:hypothetical protein
MNLIARTTLLLFSILWFNLHADSNSLPDNKTLLHLSFDKRNMLADTGDYNMKGIKGSPEQCPGKVGRGVKFDANSVIIPSHPLFMDSLQKPFTLDMWLYLEKFGQTGDMPIINAKNFGFVLFTNARGNVYAYMSTTKQKWKISMARGLILTPDIWHHLRFSYNGNDEITWELDGKKYVDKSITGKRLKNANDGSLYIGGKYGRGVFQGRIDELMIVSGYNSVSVKMDKNTLNAVLDNKLIFYAPFDDSPTATVAKGQAKPVYFDKGIKYVDGIKGNAATIKNNGIAYSSSENIEHKAGTIMFWFKGFDPNNLSKHKYDRQKYFFEVGHWNEAMRLYWPGNGQRMLFYEFLCMGGQPGELVTSGVKCLFFNPGNKWMGPTKWHHIAFTWEDPKEVRLYFDGSPVNEQGKVCMPADMGNEFILGRGTPDLVIDELKIYNDVLPAAFIKAAYDEINNELNKKTIKITGMMPNSTNTEQSPELAAEPWYHNKLGENDLVPFPWQPLKVKDGTVSAWGENYKFQGPFPATVKLRDGTELLTAPIVLKAKTADGRELTFEYKSNKFYETQKSRVGLKVSGKSKGITVSGKTTVEFDGFVKSNFVLTFKNDTKLSALWLEIPLKREFCKYYNIGGMYESYLGIPSGKLPDRGMENKFEPYLWLGDEDRGFCWCCESNWNWNIGSPEQVIQISKDNKLPMVRINICDKTTEFAANQKYDYTFGFIATPSRPMIKDRRLMFRKSAIDKTSMSFPDDNIKIWTPFLWSEPWLTFSPADPVVYGKLKLNRNPYLKKIISNSLPFNWARTVAEFGSKEQTKRYYIMPYLNFQKYGYQSNGKYIDDTYAKYSEFWEKIPQGFNRWPIFNELWSKSFNFCPNSKAFCDYYVWNFKQFLDRYPMINGVYIDETFTYYCTNLKHGCGIKTVNGDLTGKWPIFAHRELMKRIYKVAKERNPDFIFFTHDSQFLKPPQRSFSDMSTGGEPIHMKDSDDPLEATTFDRPQPQFLERLKAEFLGRQFGVAPFYLPEVIKVGNRSESRPKICTMRLMHLLFLHDIQVWPMFCTENEVRKVQNAQIKYGLDNSSEFLPYWEFEEGRRTEAKSPDKNIKCSIYRMKNGNLMIVVYNIGQEAFAGKISFNWKKLGTEFSTASDFEVASGRGEINSATPGGLEISIAPRDGMSIGFKRNIK